MSGEPRGITYGATYIDDDDDMEGDIVVTMPRANPQAIQIARAIARGDDPFTTVSPGTALDRRDSVINNFDDIVGNIYLFGGNHLLSNADGAEIEGDVVVDQRREMLYSLGSVLPSGPSVGIAGKLGGEEEEGDDDDDEGGGIERFSSFAELIEEIPDHHLTFDNAGVLTGNLIVLTHDEDCRNTQHRRNSRAHQGAGQLRSRDTAIAPLAAAHIDGQARGG